MRDMGQADSDIVSILDRTTAVPAPNNLGATFVETPSFPRIDMHTNTIATRGNHQPVYEYGPEDDKTRAGTTGIYSNPYGELITGAAKLGHVVDSTGDRPFGHLRVPEEQGPSTRAGGARLHPVRSIPGRAVGDERQHHRVQG
jgi:hypothetical protein